MKTLIFSLLLTVLFFLSAKSQNFYVIKVEGIVFTDEKKLATGDKLTIENTLKFTAKDDILYLLSPNDGYFKLSPAEQEDTSSDWMVSIKNAIIPQNKYYQTATRSATVGEAYFEDIYDLMGFFRDDVLIVDEGNYKYDPDKIKLDKNHYFEFKMKDGSAALNFQAADNTFSLKPNTGRARLEMNYVQNQNVTKIGEFTLQTVPRKNISDELSVFFNESTDNNFTLIYFEQVVPYITNVYGNTNMETIQNIIKTDLKVPLVVRE